MDEVPIGKSLFVHSLRGKLEDLYLVQQEIGTGGTSKVYSALSKITQETRAVKSINKASIRYL